MNNDILSGLRKLNFEELIHIDTDDASNYTYDIYAANGKIHKIKPDGIGGCHKCEDGGCVKNPSHKLRFISHGAHTVDFLSDYSIDFSGWSNAPILFLLESPGGDGKFYADEKKLSKMPTTQWYWVHGGIADLNLEENAKRRKYGEFFASIINHFKLSNVYVTNLVKCGLGVKEKSEFNTWKYDEEIVENCFKEYLTKELEIIKPQAVFAFSGRVYNRFRKIYSDRYNGGENLFYMPHPNARFMSQEKYRQMALSYLLQGLYKSKVITEPEKQDYFRQLDLP